MRVDKYYSEGAGERSNSEDSPNHGEHAKGSGPKVGAILERVYDSKLFLPVMFILILIIAVMLRAGLLQFQGLFEPDGFFYYSVISQMIAHHMVFGPATSALSGFPFHNAIGESPGLLAVTTIPYYILGFTGLSYYTIMRFMPIIFGMLEAILAYFIAKRLSNSKALGLLAMFFVAVSSGNIARTAGAVYRGDSFVSLFLMLALLFMLNAYYSKDRRWIIVNTVISAIALSLGLVVWNGSSFIIVIYMLSLFLVLLYSFITDNQKLAFINLCLSVGLLLTYALQSAYIYLHMANYGLPFGPGPQGPLFVALFDVPLIVGGIAVYYLTKKKLFNSEVKRVAISICAVLVFAVVLLVLFRPLISELTSQVGVSTSTQTNQSATNVPIGQTTQELQPPSYGFLLSSFNIQLTLGMLIGYLLSLNSSISNSIIVLFTLLFTWIGIILYLFLNDRAGKDPEDRHFKLGGITINISAPLLVLGSYAAVTTYLQLSAIRYNALISIPIAIFAAYTVYIISMLVYKRAVKGLALPALIGMAVVIASVYLIYDLRSVLTSSFASVSAAAVLACLALISLIIYIIYAVATKRLEIKYVIIVAVLVLMAFAFYNTYFESYTAAQADGINPQFLQAMVWLRNNTPSNATVLALWPDGSVVEGWGNRTGYMDSVGGENGTRIYYFSKWLFQTSPDTKYLYGIGKPQYLVSRNFWYAELGGIAQEGEVANASDYGYIQLNSMNSTNNGTATFFTFSSGSYPYYEAEMVTLPGPSGEVAYKAFLGLRNSSGYTPISSIIFLNSSTSQYSVVRTGNESGSLNYSLMVLFSGHVINGAYVLGQQLVQSNVFKLTFLCNTVQCPYDNPNVTLTEVYGNGDTRIFKINYLNGSS